MSADNRKEEMVLPSSEEAQLEFDPARHRVLVPIEPDLLLCIQRAAQARGISTESLVNLLLEQRLQQLAADVSA